jgi:hypothetical protein
MFSFLQLQVSVSAGACAGHVNVETVRVAAGMLHQSHAAARAIQATREALREYSGCFCISRGLDGPKRV